MERYEVDELLKLTPEEELKISETKKISKTKMDIYYKLGWHMVYISILSIICSYLFSYLFLIITTISLVVFLIANKIDLDRNISTEEGMNLAKNYNMLYFECSAKSFDKVCSSGCYVLDSCLFKNRWDPKA